MGFDSDVYVIGVLDGSLQCISCPTLGKGRIFSCTGLEMIDHLENHRNNGYKIPDSALKRLRDDYDQKA